MVVYANNCELNERDGSARLENTKHFVDWLVLENFERLERVRGGRERERGRGGGQLFRAYGQLTLAFRVHGLPIHNININLSGQAPCQTAIWLVGIA